MTKRTFLSTLLIVLYSLEFALSQPHLIITGVYDGPLTGGTPKGVELYVISYISDLSAYGLGSATNGGGSDGEEFTFPTDAASVGDYIYIAYEATQFNNWFGFAPDYTSGFMNINGDDAIELFYNSSAVDVFGDINTDGTGETWEYLDGWAYSKSNRGHNTTFNDAHWTYSGTDAWDDDASNNNDSSSPPFPKGTFSYTDGSLPVELISFTAISSNGKVVLQWITESEIENLGFLLERRAESMEHRVWDSVADYKTNAALTGQGSVTHRTEYKYTDEKVRVGQTYEYLLVDVDYYGKETRHDPVSVTVRARGITMNSAYPNPFNPVTKFTVIVRYPQHLSINVYDITGHLVKILTNERVPAGEHIIAWDGTNSRSQIAASGIYFVRLIASGTTNIQKVVLTR